MPAGTLMVVLSSTLSVKAASSPPIELSGNIQVQVYDFLAEDKRSEYHVFLTTETSDGEKFRVELLQQAGDNHSSFFRKFISVDNGTMLVDPIGELPENNIPTSAVFRGFSGTWHELHFQHRFAVQ